MNNDVLSLLHPSLGLAFTAEFKPHGDGPMFVNCTATDRIEYGFIAGNKAADNLPPNCDGCRESISGDLFCCQEIDNAR